MEEINYSEIYDMCGIDMDDTSTTGDITSSNTDKEGNNNQHSKIPTLQKVARKVVLDQNCLMFRIIEGNCLIEWKLLIEFCIHCLIMIYCMRMENDLA